MGIDCYLAVNFANVGKLEEEDTQGYVVTLQTRFEGAKEASVLATNKPNSLESQFTPSYGMVLNLLQSYTLESLKIN